MIYFFMSLLGKRKNTEKYSFYDGLTSMAAVFGVDLKTFIRKDKRLHDIVRSRVDLNSQTNLEVIKDILSLVKEGIKEIEQLHRTSVYDHQPDIELKIFALLSVDNFIQAEECFLTEQNVISQGLDLIKRLGAKARKFDYTALTPEYLLVSDCVEFSVQMLTYLQDYISVQRLDNEEYVY